MKALEVKIKKFKALENVEAQLKGNHILLLGDNGMGKSTFIQFLQIATGDNSHLPPNAEGSGEVTMDMNGNEVKFSLKFKDNNPYIKVTGNGISIDNNKSAIAQLVGANSFNIDEFANLSLTKSGRKEQVERFKKFLPLDVQQELAKFEANLANKMSERTELGKDVTKLKGSISLHPLNNLPDFELEKFVEVDTSALMSELKVINSENEKVKEVEAGMVRRSEANKKIQSKIEELAKQISELEQEQEKNELDIEKGVEWLKTHKIKPVAEIESKIENAAKDNQKSNSAKALLSERKKLKDYSDEYGEMTAEIESTREAIANAIREMESPIDGLTYDDEQLVYNNVPVHPDSLSKSEIMELGILLKLAENPNNILFIQEAESLGTERFMRIREIADKHNCQIIAEQVQRGTKELCIEIMTDELIG